MRSPSRKGPNLVQHPPSALRLFSIACLPLIVGGACQRLEQHLSDGLGTSNVMTGSSTGGSTVENGVGSGGMSPSQGSTGGQGATDWDGSIAPADGGSPADGTVASCDTLREGARAALATNCAFCHQTPTSLHSPYGQGSFDFILELDRLTTLVSPNSAVGFPMKYVVKGDPSKSYIFQRISNGTMPPLAAPKRPTDAEKQALKDWITSCIDGGSGGWPAPSTDVPDAGIPPFPTGCGGPGQPCCAANVCNGGGCCVFNLCHANGATCAGAPATATTPAVVGLAGTCSAGSCQTDTGMACGKPAEPCCGLMTCTASQSSCLAGMTMCSACGGTGQSCCKPNGCLDGRTCVGGGVGRIGTCFMCGGVGQPCCGAGSFGQQTCTDSALTCTMVAGMGNLCLSATSGAGGSGAGAATGAGGVAGPGGAGRGGAGG